jgi:hypothetical protein
MWKKINKRLNFLKINQNLLLVRIVPFLIYLSLFLLSVITVGADPTTPPPPPKT